MSILDTVGPAHDGSAEDRINDLLVVAKQAIGQGQSQMKVAAENIAAAIDAGATQRAVATTIEKSPSFVNRLLKWREDGYRDETPFGAQSKASRERVARVQAAEQKKGKSATTSEQAQASAERARAETAKAEATKAKADAARAKAEAAKARAEYRAARSNARARAYGHFSSGDIEPQSIKNPDATLRNKLVKLLGMLGSDYPAERSNAGTLIENLRKEIGLTWDELIVPAATNIDAKAA